MKKILGLVIAILLVTSSWAVASIPHSTTGVITGCYSNVGGIVGRLRVIDKEAGDSCIASETELSWNQTGPQGPAGAIGPQGPQGETGATGPQGPAGPSNGYDSGVGGVVTVSNSGPTWVTVQSVILPAGSYILNSSAAPVATGNSSRCRLFDGANMIDFRYFGSVSKSESSPMGSVILGSQTTVTLDCERTIGTYQIELARVTAVKVGSLNQ